MSVPDPDLEKNGGGGGRGGGGRRGRHPDPERSGGVRSPKNISGPFKPQFFGLKIRGGPRPYPGSAPEY